MNVCDTCGEVRSLWLHREYHGSMTHRKNRWACIDCHPQFRAAGPDTGSEDADSVTMMTDGGSANACPNCAGTTINGQGLYACLECEWSGTR